MTAYQMTEISSKTQRFFSIAITSGLCWAFAYLATNIYKNYALGLFVWLPIVLGLTSTLIFSYKNSVDRKVLRDNAYLTLLIFCLGLLFFAWEGIICLMMAAPIGLLFTYVGFLIGHYISKSKARHQTPTAIILLFLSVPSLMSFKTV